MKTLSQFLRISVLILLPVLLFIVGCEEDAPTTPSGKTTVSGTITDEQGYSVPNAIIEALDDRNLAIAADTTDEDGAFTLNELPEDFTAMSVLVSHGDFKTYIEDLEALVASASGPEVLSLVLEHEDSCCNKIMVTVKKDGTDDGIAEAEVKLRRRGDLIQKTTTNSDGEAVFGFVCDGEYDVRIARDGYAVVEKIIEIKECDSTTVEAFLEEKEGEGNDSCCQGKLTITPKDSASGDPLSGAEIRVSKDGKKRTKESGANGAEFLEMCEGKYEVRVEKKGYKVIEFAVEMGCDDSVEVEKLLVEKEEEECCKGVLRIEVDDAGGNPISGGKVKIWRNGSVVEDAEIKDGKVVFDGLCEGGYGVDIIREGYKAIEFEVEIGCDEEKTVEKTLEKKEEEECCKGVLTVEIDDAEGNAISGGKVVLRKNGKAVEDAQIKDGKVVFDGLCEGEYGILVTREGYKAIEFEVAIGCDEEKTVEKVLEKKEEEECCKGVLTIEVEDGEGNAISGGKVKIWKNGSVVEDAEIKDGKVVFDGLCEGGYGVDIIREGYKAIEFEVEMGCDEEKTVEKVLEKKEEDCCSAGLILRVKDSESEEAISDATIVIKKNGDILGDGETNSDGKYVREKLCAGSSYSVTIEKEGYKTKTFEFTVGADCKTVEESILLEKD